MDELELRLAWEQYVAGGARTSAASEWFDAVLAHHLEPHRRYHTLRHVRWVVRHAIDLAELPRVRDRVARPGAVVAAAFFHDAVYDATRSDNEAQSAALAQRALDQLGWPADACAAVVELVEATAGHAAVAEPGAPLDTAVLLAADLAVLAGDPASYAEYVTGVRHEYGHVSDADWRIGRGRVLQSFVDRPAIYDPALGLDQWERRARANIAAELSTLEGATPSGG